MDKHGLDFQSLSELINVFRSFGLSFFDTKTKEIRCSKKSASLNLENQILDLLEEIKSNQVFPTLCVLIS